MSRIVLANDNVNDTPIAGMTIIKTHGGRTRLIDAGGNVYYLARSPETLELLTAATLNTKHKIVAADASGGAFTITLPAGATVDPEGYIIKNVGATNNVTVDADGTEDIDGSLTLVLTPGQVARLYYTPLGWLSL